MVTNVKLPKESESQEIGHFAVMAFNNCHPTSWRTTPTDGDADAGLDVQVQIVDQGHFTNMFNVQIKGCAQMKDRSNLRLSADKKHFAQSMDVSTLNYYARIENPVMLVFADLAHDTNPRLCPVYYLWIDEEIDKLRDGKPNLDHLGKDSHTFHIPVENVLNGDLNVLPHLNSRLEKKRALDGIYNVVEKKYPDPVSKVTRLGIVLETNKIALDTILNETETPWLDAPKDSFAYELKKVSEILSLNNANLAADNLDRLAAKLEDANDHEKSEYYYQRALLAALMGDRRQASQLYEQAHLTSTGIKKYRVAYLESLIPYEKTDNIIIEDILSQIEKENDVDYLRLKSKLNALKGEYTKAFEILKNQDEKDVFVLKGLIYFLSRAYSDCINYIDQSFSTQELSDRQALSLRALKARAHFTLGFGNLPSEPIPFSGTPEMNPEILKKAWIELLTAWDLAYKLGYPPDVEIMIDMLSILGMYFAESDIVKKHLIKLAELRPTVLSIQECLLQVAMHLDDRIIATQQLYKLPKTLTNSIIAIILDSRKDNKLDVVTLTQEILSNLIEERPDNCETVIAIAAECANELLMYDKRDNFLKALQLFPDSEAWVTVYEFIVTLNQNPLQKAEATETLYTVYRGGFKNDQILIQLLINLNPYKLETAQKVIEVANDITSKRDLVEDEYIILCDAKVTVKDWPGVLETSHKAQIRFATNPRFKAFEALALDEIGDTGKSIELLEEIAKGEKYDRLALEIYINIAARCGLIDKAKTLVARLLEKASQREQKLHLLRLLVIIEIYIDPKGKTSIEACIKYGQLCNKDDESEEGLYILQFMAATLDPEKSVPSGVVTEFQDRLKKFTEHFPESKIFRSITFNEEAPEDFLAKLEQLTGFTEEKRKWYRRNENLLSRSQFPVPFVIRHKILLNVSNFLHLWEFCKVAGKDCPQYQLCISNGLYEARKIENFNKRIPLIDEVALVILFDLGLLECLFRIFALVAITKDSIYNLQKMAQHIFYTPFSTKAKDIIELLSKHVSNIQQPSSKRSMDEDELFHELDSLKSVYDPAKYLFYTDDTIARLFICGDDHFKDTICTIDVIEILRESEIISRKEAAEKYASLCFFNVVGTPVNFKDILIVVEDQLPTGKSIEEYCNILARNHSLRSFTDALWSSKGDYSTVLEQIGQFLSYMISGTDGIEIEQNIVTAIWYIWYQKVQFIIKSEQHKLHFLARSFLATAIVLVNRIDSEKDIAQHWVMAWSIYNDIVCLIYGNDMSRDIEHESKTILAKMIVEFELKSKIKVFRRVATGLVSGSAESDYFQQAYLKYRVSLGTKK